jgi:hypothetical protein
LSWGPNKAKAARLAAALLIAGSASAAAAEVLVVRALGPSAKSYPAGKKIADDARITLQGNDTLVLLDSRGTRTLRGPGTFTPSGPAQANTRSALASVASGPARRARIGAVRNVGGGEVRPASIWHVDVAKSSNVCLTDPAHVTLWRSDATKPVALTVTRASDGTSRTVQWDAGEPTISWPSDLAVTSDAQYRLSWEGAEKPTLVTVKTIPSEPDPEAMASTLIQNDCTAQLDVLIAALERPAMAAATPDK